MSDPLGWIDELARAWNAQGLERRLSPRSAGDAGTVVRDGQTLVNFGSNDYLGLANDPRVRDAAMRAVARFGWGAGASPLVTGWTTAHQELADAIATFEGTEAALIFPSGFAANLGTLTALVGTGDAVFADRLAHACLIDGARLSGARLRVFPHNDAARLEAILTREREQFRRVLIVTEGIFSMDGDLAPLADLVAVAERFDAMLMVDEAHATGVVGPTGGGAASACGVADRVPIRVGTLSKALGSVGGFVAGSRRLIDWLVNRARPFVFSTSLPPAAAAAAGEALRIVQSEPSRRETLHTLSTNLRSALHAHGFPVAAGISPIVPVMFGEAERALSAARHLHALGFHVPAIRPPTVPNDTARLRISLSADHDQDVLNRLVDAFAGLENRP